MKKRILDKDEIDDIINLYVNEKKTVNKISVEKHLNKNKIYTILIDNGISLRKKGELNKKYDKTKMFNYYKIKKYIPTEKYSYVAISKDDKKIQFSDYMNKSGCLSKYIKNTYNIEPLSNYNYICQGIGGKLFQYFITKFKPECVISFADRRWTPNPDDNIYVKLGFKLEHITPPDYKYINLKINKFKRFHKFGLNKKKLSKLYGFPLTMTEKEMAIKAGYDRIWDCGLFKYIWINDKIIKKGA